MHSWKRFWKYAALAAAAVLWSAGLIGQFESAEMVMRYMAISAAMVAVATA